MKIINWLMRYQVVDHANQVIATTRTKWTADLLAETLTKLDMGLVPFSVVDANGQPIKEEEDDQTDNNYKST